MGDIEYRLRHRYLDMIYTPDTLRRAHLPRADHPNDPQQSRRARLHGGRNPDAHAIAGALPRAPFETHRQHARYQPLHASRSSCRSSGYSSAGSRRCTRSAGCSATRASARGTTSSSPCWNSIRRTAISHIMDLTEGLIVACVDSLGSGRSAALRRRHRELQSAVPQRRPVLRPVPHRTLGCDMFDEDRGSRAARGGGVALELAALHTRRPG